MAVSSHTHRELQPALPPAEVVPGTQAAASGAEQVLPSAMGSLLLPAEEPGSPARRLVVLVPDVDVDEAALAGRIWSLASPRELEVLYLGTVRQAPEEFRARRRLALIAAITRDRTVRVESTFAFGANWVVAARSVLRPGDLVICHAELQSSSGLRRKPLASVLLVGLKAPIYVLSGFYPEPPHERTLWLRQLAVWCPPLAILLGFFVIQARLLQSASGWLPSALFYASVVAEFVLILAWEHFLGTPQ